MSCNVNSVIFRDLIVDPKKQGKAVIRSAKFNRHALATIHTRKRQGL
jgi:hypothetical protein